MNSFSRFLATFRFAAGVCALLPGLAWAGPGIEPRNEEEARLQNKFADKISAETYGRWLDYVKASEPEKQAWLRTLEDNLGGYYFPVLLNQTLFGPRPYNEAGDAWAHVKDDPALPRVIIIGDSISRAYTARVRSKLAGRANVHRAPANCGPTGNFLKNGDIWLNQNGSDRWDYVIVNFGIHDGKNPDGYEERLRQVIARLKKTGAKEIFWVRTTPWGKDAAVFDGPAGDASAITNPISDRIAREEGLAVIDAHATLSPLIATGLNKKDFTHWSPEANAALGDHIAATLATSLEKHRSGGE